MTTPARPSLIRGATMPVYIPRGADSTSAHQAVAQVFLPPIQSASGETFRRILGSSDVQASAAHNPTPRPHPASTGAATFMAPSISSPPPSSTRPLSARNSPPKHPVSMEIETSSTQHILFAPIGSQFHSDCITIAAKKGNCLLIVADRWDTEEDCRYEWLVRFDRDADMSAILASFDSGILKVTVKRLKTQHS